MVRPGQGHLQSLGPVLCRPAIQQQALQGFGRYRLRVEQAEDTLRGVDDGEVRPLLDTDRLGRWSERTLAQASAQIPGDAPPRLPRLGPAVARDRSACRVLDHQTGSEQAPARGVRSDDVQPPGDEPGGGTHQDLLGSTEGATSSS